MISNTSSKVCSYLVVIFGILLFSLTPIHQITAASTTYLQTEVTTEPESGQYIYDYGNLFSDSEIEALLQQIDEVSNKYNCNILILTNTDPIHDTVTYINDFFDLAYDDNIVQESTAVLMISMWDRSVDIRAYGDCMNQMPSSTCDRIREAITSNLTSGNYYEAATTFTKKVDRYMEFKYADNLFFQPWFLILISAVIGGGSVLIMGINHGSRITTNDHTYLDEEHSRIVFQHDNYIRTVVTKVRKPQNNGGGGHGGGGHSMSSGGHASSGSHGHF